MTSFALNSGIDEAVRRAPEVARRASPAANRFALDSLIAKRRSETSQEVLNQRSTPRYSIAELNEADFKDIQRRFNASKPDDRTPIVKVLDLIDLPRNTIANVVFRGAAEDAERRGEFGAFNQPRVMFSDALERMGVENKVIRGVLGFVGDVALDPLTYVGGAGGALRLSSSGGRVAVTKAGKKQLESAIAARAAGRAAQTTSAGRAVNALAGNYDVVGRRAELAAKNISGKEAQRVIESELRAAVIGTPSRPGINRVLRKANFDETVKDSPLARTLLGVGDTSIDARSAARQRAVGEFVEEFALGGPKQAGLSLARAGRAGTQIAHIPFTDVSFRVPGFTKNAAIANRNLALARAPLAASRLGDAGNATQEALRAAQKVGSEASDIAADIAAEAPQVGLTGTREGVAAVLRSHGVERADSLVDEVGVEVAEEYAERLEDLRKQADAARDRAQELAITARTQGVEQGLSVGEMRANAAVHRAMDAEAARLRALHKSEAAMIGSVKEAKKGAENAARREAADLVEALENGDIDAAEFEDLITDAYEAELRRARELPDDLLNASDQELAAQQVRVDAIQQEAEALHQQARVAQSTLVYAAQSDLHKDAVNTARLFLGTASEEIGRSVLLSTAAAAKMLTGDDSVVVNTLNDLDALRRVGFGNKGTLVGEYVRRANAFGGMSAASFAKRMVERDMVALKRIFKENGVPAADWDFDEAMEVVHALQIEQANPGLRMFSENLDGTPSAWVEVLAKAKEKGWNNTAKYKGLWEALNKRAAEFTEQGRILGQAELEDGLVTHLREFYIPSVATQEFSDSARLSRNIDPFTNELAQTPTGGAQAFQLARTTDVTRFPMGETLVEFYEFERARVAAYLTVDPLTGRTIVNDAAIARQHTDKVAKELKETADKIAFYDNSDAAFKTKHSTRSVDNFTKNKLVSEGWLQSLVGENGVKAFETNASYVYARRFASHQRATARQGFKEYAQRHGVFVPADAWRNHQGGTQVPLEGGAVARFVREKDGAPLVEIGGVRYRAVADGTVDRTKSVFGDLVPAESGLTNDTNRVLLLPEQVAEAVERVFQSSGDPTVVSGFLKATDKILSAWKQYTLFHPSWTIGNVIGDTWLAMSVGANPARMATATPDVVRALMARGDPKLLAGRTVTVAGEKIPAEDFLADMVSMGVMDATIWDDLGVRMVHDGTIQFDNLSAVEKANRTIAQSKALSSKYAVGIKGGLVLKNKATQYWGAWFKVNQQISNTMRSAAYISLVEGGMDSAEAARQIARGMFDYQDLTKFEVETMRRIFPFYTWVRNSMAFSFARTLEQPAYAGIAPKLTEAIEEMLSGDNEIPRHQRPRWMQEQMAIQLSEDPETRSVFTAGTLMPTEQFYRTASFPAGGPQGAMDFFNFMLSNAAPTVKFPVELAFGRELFTDRVIGATATEGDIGAFDALASQIRPVREFGLVGVRRGPLQAAADRGPTALALRGTLGGRIQPFTDDSIRFGSIREYREREQNARRAVRLAVREGNDRFLMRARLALMQIYANAIEQGIGDEVPKWARDQIERFSD